MHPPSNPANRNSHRDGDTLIGELQRIPAEESSINNLGQKYSLHIEITKVNDTEALKIIYCVKISNRDEFSDEIVHEILIKGECEEINKKLKDLSIALQKMSFIETRIDSEIAKKIEQMQKEGKILVRSPGAISKEDLPHLSLPDGLNVRRSRYDVQDIFFIIQGMEKEDTATEPPFKIEVEGEGDFVSLSRKNIDSFLSALIHIRWEVWEKYQNQSV